MPDPSPELIRNAGESSPQPRARDEGAFTFKQRVALWLISWAGYLAIWLICSTLKYEVSVEDLEDIPESFPEAPLIAPFWHRCVFPAAYFFRGKRIAVMTSRSFDGEYIARIISKFGFVPVRGSSSRSGARALLGMHKIVKQPGIAAFTIDGPRGPIYVAKPGPVLLARNTQAPIRAFYVALSDAWELKSWDRFMIPKPFGRAHLRFSAPIRVPEDSDEAQMKELHQQMQAALERVQSGAEKAVGRGDGPLRSA